MTLHALHVNDHVVLEHEHFEQLFTVLRSREYQVVGPTVRDQAIVYDTLTSVADLPIGYTDEQDGGAYRLKKRADKALFGYAVGPHSWKKFLHPPITRLWQARREGDGFHITPENQAAPKYAFLGVRSCELHAIAIQDKVFMGSRYTDPTYQARRDDLFIVAVNCGQAGGTCFCVSMQTGPKATFGFDLALTEVLEANRHSFVVQVGTETVEDVTDLAGEQAERWRKWDSCFTMDFSYIYGGSIRTSTRSRYRQWMTHKLSTWFDQFGTSGCVGCGRCITWCPVGIDITEEVRAIHESEKTSTFLTKEEE